LIAGKGVNTQAAFVSKAMDAIHIEVWLYGPIARYAGEQSQGSYAELHLEFPAGSTLQDLIDHLGLPAEEKGITFVNGSLAALPGLDSDRKVVLHDGDRVGISHRKSMWPFQYRFGASQTSELQETFRQRDDRGIHHAYTQADE
jgi:sulfur carrier protein ThiS